ncbi:MAG: hypothetical protein EXQ70_11880 [Solirubrobacterales bacterium]|nr:hypothetical protein [Solirubrobacterales bacterium]
MRKRIGRPSPAMIVALIALFVALGGASYAAVKIGKNAVKTKNIANKSVTTKKLAVSARGAAVAYAQVASDGTVTSGRGIKSSNISSNVGGFYCFAGVPSFGAASVTPSFTNDEFGSFAIATLSKPASGDISCDPGTQFAVVTQFFVIVGGTIFADDPFHPEGFTIVLHK